MKAKSVFVYILLMVIGVQTLWAQKVVLYKTGGQTIECEVSEMDSIVFLSGKPKPSSLICPDDHHPHSIDLGLPSGTKWCCCNVGADSPEAYGGHYAWGETSEKDDYSSSTYTHYGEDIGTDISGTIYDAAFMVMGSPWHMPSLVQQKELINNCTIQWTQLNDVNGILLTGSNGNKLFLPAAGDWNGTTYESAGNYGSYWSSNPSGSYNASGYCFYSSGRREFYNYGIRYTAQSIRAVCTQ